MPDKTKNQERGRFLYVRSLPGSVKALFKSRCAKNGRSMTHVVEALMRLYIAEPEKVDYYINEVEGL